MTSGRVELAGRSDAELLAAHCAGDREAFAEIFRRHKDRMWAVAVRTCGDPELASDCVQDAFIAAYRRAGSFRGESAVTTWLHRIVELRLDVRAALDQLPEGQRAALVLVDMHGLSVAETAEILGVAEGTIKSRCARGRAAMAHLLGIRR